MIILFFLILSILYGIKIPLWMPYDEPFHYNYIAIIAEKRIIPRINGDMSIATYQAHHPPLYYAFCSIFYRFGKNRIERGRILRVLSSFIGVATIYVIYISSKNLFSFPYFLCPVAFTSSIPMLLVNFSSITNDVFATFFSTLTIFFMLNINVNTNNHLKKIIYISLFSCFAILSKATTIFLIPISILSIIIKGNKTDYKTFAKSIFVYLIIVILICSWWFIRTTVIYGDPLARKAIAKIEGRHSINLMNPIQFVRWNALLFSQFWYFSNDLRNYIPKLSRVIYIPFLFSSLFIFVGVFASFVRREGSRENSFIILLLLLLIYLEIYLNSFRVYAPTGRYLFPCILPISFLFTEGVKFFLSERYVKSFLAFYFLFFIAFNLLLIKLCIWNLLPLPLNPYY